MTTSIIELEQTIVFFTFVQTLKLLSNSQICQRELSIVPKQICAVNGFQWFSTGFRWFQRCFNGLQTGFNGKYQRVPMVSTGCRGFRLTAQPRFCEANRSVGLHRQPHQPQLLRFFSFCYISWRFSQGCQYIFNHLLWKKKCSVITVKI